MASVRSVFPAGHPCHILQHGAGARSLFRKDKDRYVYLQLLREAGETHGLSFDGYCLMSDHIHLIAIPAGEDSLERGLRWLQRAYAGYRRGSYGGGGRLWRTPLCCSLAGGPDRWKALAYAEVNPVRAGLCAAPEDYGWSSARAHLDSDKPHLLLRLGTWALEWDAVTWRTALGRMGGDYLFWRRLREATRTGGPLEAARTSACLEWRSGQFFRSRSRAMAAKAAAAGRSGPAPAQARLDFGA